MEAGNGVGKVIESCWSCVPEDEELGTMVRVFAGRQGSLSRSRSVLEGIAEVPSRVGRAFFS